jgi:hypothetical protein
VSSLQTPHILYINDFQAKDSGVYLCRTTNSEGKYVEIGVELRARNGSIQVRLIKEEESGRVDESRLEMVAEEEDVGQLPNIKITFSDKLALARGERVELFCNSGKGRLFIVEFAHRKIKALYRH